MSWTRPWGRRCAAGCAHHRPRGGRRRLPARAAPRGRRARARSGRPAVVAPPVGRGPPGQPRRPGRRPRRARDRRALAPGPRRTPGARRDRRRAPGGRADLPAGRGGRAVDADIPGLREPGRRERGSRVRPARRLCQRAVRVHRSHPTPFTASASRPSPSSCSRRSNGGSTTWSRSTTARARPTPTARRTSRDRGRLRGRAGGLMARERVGVHRSPDDAGPGPGRAARGTGTDRRAGAGRPARDGHGRVTATPTGTGQRRPGAGGGRAAPARSRPRARTVGRPVPPLGQPRVVRVALRPPPGAQTTAATTRWRLTHPHLSVDVWEHLVENATSAGYLTGQWHRAREVLRGLRALVGGRRAHQQRPPRRLDLLQRGRVPSRAMARPLGHRRPAEPRSADARGAAGIAPPPPPATWPACAPNWPPCGAWNACSCTTTSCGARPRWPHGPKRMPRCPGPLPTAPPRRTTCGPSPTPPHGSATTARWERPGRSTWPPSSTGSTAGTPARPGSALAGWERIGHVPMRPSRTSRSRRPRPARRPRLRARAPAAGREIAADSGRARCSPAPTRSPSARAGLRERRTKESSRTARPRCSGSSPRAERTPRSGRPCSCTQDRQRPRLADHRQARCRQPHGGLRDRPSTGTASVTDVETSSHLSVVASRALPPGPPWPGRARSGTTRPACPRRRRHPPRAGGPSRPARCAPSP